MNRLQQLKYLNGYPEQVTVQVQKLITEKRLVAAILERFPVAHEIKTDRALYKFTVDLKNQFLRKTPPLSKVTFDNKINVLHDALGLHTFISRVQGGKLKAKNEICIGSVLKTAPVEFLRIIVVHELTHLKEKEHNKAFYQLCEYIEPNYHQLEFDLRVYLTCLDLFGPLY
jgi:predicted metal-dependent hydrolase